MLSEAKHQRSPHEKSAFGREFCGGSVDSSLRSEWETL